MYATMNPVPGFPDDFVPVDPGVYAPVGPGVYAPGVSAGPPRRAPGLRASVTAWVSNGVAWVSLFTCAVLFFVAILQALGGNDSDGWVFAAAVLYVVGVVATVSAAAASIMSLVRRLRADDLHRTGPIVDLVLLAVVTTISVAASAYPLVFFL